MLGEAIGPSDRRAYAAEIEQVRGLLLADETIELDVPTVRANTVTATEAYAATTPSCRDQVRVDLFSAYWRQDRNIGDSAVLDAMGLAWRSPVAAAAWREEWLALDRPLVPIMVLPDGYVSRGLGALARLGDLIGNRARVHTQANGEAVMSSDSFGSRARLAVGPRSYEYFALSALDHFDIARLPYCAEDPAREPASPRGRGVSHRSRHRGARDLGSIGSPDPRDRVLAGSHPAAGFHRRARSGRHGGNA